MSVVNRMLQDIDRRVGAAAIDAPGGPYPDVRSVPPKAPRAKAIAWVAGGLVLSVAVGAMVAAGWGERRWGSDAPSAAPLQPAATALPATATAPVKPPEPVARAVDSAANAAPAEKRSIPEPTPAPPIAATAEVRAVPASKPPPPVAARLPVDSFKLSLILSPLPARLPSREVKPPGAAAKPAREVVNTNATAKTVVAVRQVAAGETVSAARQLWNEGSRAGARATLREALAAAEASRNPQATQLLARELARFEVADNRAQPALELLTRLSGLFGEDADALALRGNAQQRLALHSEAAESYLAALRLRPTEGKWMVGAAISLAADGRTDEARSWAGRARASGAVTPPIAAYLEQLGIGSRP